MTTFIRGACASVFLGFGLTLVGCGGGGGGGMTTPTASPTASPTATPGGSGPITSSQLVFVSTRTGVSELFKANADGTSAVQLTTIGKTKGISIEKPSVSPDGRRIVFQIDNLSSLQIGVVNTDGSGYAQLTNDGSAINDYSPVFSADGSSIFYARSNSSGAKTPHVFRMDASGANQNQFISELSEFPSVSSSGSTLAYATTDSSASAPITLFNLSTNTVTKRVGTGVPPGSPFNLALSPDGSRVAFSTPNGSSAQVNIVNVASGTTAATIPSGNVFNGGEAWSRDSQTLYFDALLAPNAKLQLYSLPAPFTSTPHQLSADAQGANYSPAFLSGG